MSRAKTKPKPVQIPAEELFRLSNIPPDVGISKQQIVRLQLRYPHIRLETVKFPGGANATRLTCRTWIRQYIAELDAERASAA